VGRELCQVQSFVPVVGKPISLAAVEEEEEEAGGGGEMT